MYVITEINLKLSHENNLTLGNNNYYIYITNNNRLLILQITKKLRSSNDALKSSYITTSFTL